MATPNIPAQFRLVEGIELDGSGCWLWTKSLDRKGYGRLSYLNETKAHRVAYRLLKGELSPTTYLDHLCRVRKCVNPDHLEIASLRENTLRGVGPSAANAQKTHCSQGHAYDVINTYYKPSKPNERVCRKCAAAQHRQRKARAKATMTAPTVEELARFLGRSSCKHGHDFTSDNINVYPDRSWICRICKSEGNARRRQHERRSGA